MKRHPSIHSRTIPVDVETPSGDEWEAKVVLTFEGREMVESEVMDTRRAVFHDDDETSEVKRTYISAEPPKEVLLQMVAVAEEKLEEDPLR